MASKVVTSLALVRVAELKYAVLTVKTQGKKVISTELSEPDGKGMMKETFKIAASKAFFLKDQEYGTPKKSDDLFPPDGGSAA